MGPALALAWWMGLPPLPELLDSGIAELIAAAVILIGFFGLVASLVAERKIEFDQGAKEIRFYSRCLPRLHATIGFSLVGQVVASAQTHTWRDSNTNSASTISYGADLILIDDTRISLLRTTGQDDLESFLRLLTTHCKLPIERLTLASSS